MKKKWQMVKRVREIKARFRDIADLCEKEKRSMTADEKEEKNTLEVEMNILNLRILQADAPETPETQMRDAQEKAFEACVRFLRNGGQIDEEYRSLIVNGGLELPMSRSGITDSAAAEAVTPLTIGEIIPALEKGLILSKVGCKMQYGIEGAWQFPVVAGGIEATIEDEGVAITDTKVDISKLTPSPKRVAIAVPVANGAIDSSTGILLEIVRNQLILGVARLLNKWMFNKTKLSKATDGCFVKSYASASTFVGSAPTWKEVLDIEATAMEKGVVPDDTVCWVCSAKMFAKLKSTPKENGSGRFICEDGLIDGYPVYVTEYVDPNTLNFGIFSYELVGQFGKVRMTVDSTSAEVAKKDLTYFIFNTRFDMVTLRAEAFATGKAGA